jgi:hypothetical protein
MVVKQVVYPTKNKKKKKIKTHLNTYYDCKQKMMNVYAVVIISVFSSSLLLVLRDLADLG